MSDPTLARDLAGPLHLDEHACQRLVADAGTLGWTPAQLRALLAEILANPKTGDPAFAFHTRVRVQAFPKGL